MLRRLLRWKFAVLWCIVLTAVGLFSLHVYVEATTDHENVLRETTVRPGTDPTRLVVMLHGLGAGPAKLDDLVAVAGDPACGADLLVPAYDSRVLGNLTPQEITAHLVALLDDIQAERRYARITLIGHSIGAILVRKAYLDRLERGGESWARHVDRIISLAGMNRGWSIDERPKHLPVIRHRIMQGLHWVGRLSGTGHLARGLHRGSTFVGDLRVQWIRAVKSGAPLAPVLQLLGLTDDIVSREDSMDLIGAKNFLFFEVPGGHGAAVRFDDSDGGRRRKRVFTRLLTEPDLAILRENSSFDFVEKSRGERNDDVDHIVFVVHGIRDDAEWTEGLAKEIRRAAGAAEGSVRVVTTEYGYFPMGSFLVSPWRQERVQWFVDLYTQELAATTRADVKISFVGHSNGTYLLARSLLDYPHLEFHHVAFAGSVVPKDYPWATMLGEGGEPRVAAFRNDRAASDWVVAVFPRLFEVVADWTGSEDGWLAELGSGGFNGFLDGPAKARETILSGGHGAGVQPVNFPSLAQFVLTGASEPPAELVVKTAEPSGFVSFLSRICWLLWFALLAAVIYLGHRLTRWLAGREKRAVPRTISWPIYLLIVLLLIQSI